MKPVFWLVRNQQSEEQKQQRYLEEAAKIGFVVRDVTESTIQGFEVKDGRFLVRFTMELVELPTAAHSITGYPFSALMAAELMKQLEMGGVTLINQSVAQWRANNKWRTHQYLTQKNIPTPRTLYTDKKIANVRNTGSLLGYPLVLKAAFGSRGDSVWLCQSEAELVEHVSRLVPEREIILQEYLATTHGRDVRVVVVDGQVVGSMLRTAEPGGFHANLAAEGVGQPFTLSNEQRQLALAATSAIGLGLAGVDLLFKNDQELVVGEVNSNPGLGIEEMVGCNVAGAVMAKLWQLAA